jgi:hypothetical protein
MSDYKPHPLRVQRKRTKGYKLPSDTVVVSRPTKWGNPFRGSVAMFDFRLYLEMCLVQPEYPWRSEDLQHMQWIANHYKELRGKRLACWCPLTSPCHADVLAELANKED